MSKFTCSSSLVVVMLLSACGADPSDDPTCQHQCAEVGESCNGDGVTLESCSLDGDGCRVLAVHTCESGCGAATCLLPQVARPVVTNLDACEVVDASDAAAVAFSVDALTGIDHFTLTLWRTTGCDLQPTTDPLPGYPAPLSAESPGSHNFASLSPNTWYKYAIEASAQEGYQAARTQGWLRTRGAPPSMETGNRIAAGENFTCALTETGSAWCWGADYFGQMGDGGDFIQQRTPVEVAGLSGGVVAIKVGSHHACALLEGGALKCWGVDHWGQLGDGGDNIEQGSPVEVVGLSTGVNAITAGGNGHTCAILDTGAAVCWGANTSGQLGEGSIELERDTPVDVLGLSGGVVALAAGHHHTCALLDSGAVSCWGENEHGQLGNGESDTDETAPVDVVGLSGGVIAITAGEAHTCALLESGGMQCWGRSDAGQLGNGGDPGDQPTPVGVMGLASGVVATAAGGLHTCALLDTGGVQCWGWNDIGQLGDGDTHIDQTTPVDVVGLASGVVAITAGFKHNCALLATGGMKCWGAGFFGQLGIGLDMSDHGVPVDVVNFPPGD